MSDDCLPTNPSWRAQIAGKGPNASIDRLTTIIRAYHIRPKTDVEGRTALLKDIETLTLSLLREMKRDRALEAFYEPIFQLGMGAHRGLKLIERAGAMRAKLRQVFVPEKRSGVTPMEASLRWAGTGSRQLSGPHGSAPSARHNYWLEMLDPNHRSFGHEPELLAAFDAWLADSSAPNSLWDYLVQTGKGGMAGVAYLAPGDRWQYEVLFDAGRMMVRRDRAGRHVTPLSTSAMFSAHTNGAAVAVTGNSGFAQGVGIWACSTGGAFFTAAHKISEFHHSSFLAGRPVLGAGEWMVANGELLLVTNKTGHYKATPQHLAMCLSRLRRNINLDRVVCSVQDFSTGRQVDAYIMANDLIRAGGIPGGYTPQAIASSTFANGPMEPILAGIVRVLRDVGWASAQTIGTEAVWAPPTSTFPVRAPTTTVTTTARAP